MGYNGAPSGSPHCLDVGCLKYQGRCLRTVHAEMNALVEALKNGLEINAENELWCTHRPCFECSRMLHKAGVFKVRYWIEYKDPRAKFINPDMNFTRIGGISES